MTIPAPADLAGWQRLGAALFTSEGVHRPSGFSAALASHLPDLQGASVVDVGSGAGLVTIAALACGAEHVVALDRDAAALSDTERNVREHLGSDATNRLSLWRGDWSDLRVLCCDVALANPPQRPSRLLSAVPAHQRHLHEGAGHDGLGAIRALLDYCRTQTLLVTTSALLPAQPDTIPAPGYPTARRTASVPVNHDPVWSPLVTDAPTVNIWRLCRG